jgi:uncharacterized membrane protein
MQPAAPSSTTKGSLLIKAITSKLMTMLVDELNHKDTKHYLRKQVVHPIISLLYSELFPYILGIVVLLLIVLLCSSLSLMFFILLYYRRL